MGKSLKEYFILRGKMKKEKMRARKEREREGVQNAKR